MLIVGSLYVGARTRTILTRVRTAGHGDTG
jgi:hypothetical protein